jgi:hypothetical protein
VTVQRTFSDNDQENFDVNESNISEKSRNPSWKISLPARDDSLSQDITKSLKKHSSQISVEESGSPCLVRKASLDSGRRSKASDKNMARLLKVSYTYQPINSLSLNHQVVPMLLVVVLVFIICWTPLLVFEVLQSFDVIPNQLFDHHKHIKTVFSLLAYFNRYRKKENVPKYRFLDVSSCINPVIYGFMSASFRKSFCSSLWPRVFGSRDRRQAGKDIRGTENKR